MSYTPGPWKYGKEVRGSVASKWFINELPFDYASRDFGEGASIFGPNGECIVGNDEYQVFSKPEDIALMVAAPKLLEALEMFIDLADNIEAYGAMKFERDWRKVKDMRDVAWAAIRKARCEE